MLSQMCQQVLPMTAEPVEPMPAMAQRQISSPVRGSPEVGHLINVCIVSKLPSSKFYVTQDPGCSDTIPDWPGSASQHILRLVVLIPEH